MSTHTSTDPATGEVTYTYETRAVNLGELVTSATDYDTADEFSWTSYKIGYELTPGGSGTYLTGTETVFDDDTSFEFENIFSATVGNFPLDYGDRTITKDDQGRVDYVLETFDKIALHTGPVPEVSRAMDWDVATGKLDYAVTTFRDGRTEAVDYSTATGNPDYALTTYANGRMVADDYDAATGKLDYRVTTDPNGVVTATDYDIADQHSWTSYTLIIGADGKVIDSIIA